MKKIINLLESKTFIRMYKAHLEAVKYHQFTAFVESLKRENNKSLIESITKGINVILESEFVDSWRYDGSAYKTIQTRFKKWAESLNIDTSNSKWLENLYDALMDADEIPESGVIRKDAREAGGINNLAKFLFMPKMADVAIKSTPTSDTAEELFSKMVDIFDKQLAKHTYQSTESGIGTFSKNFIAREAAHDTELKKRRAAETKVADPDIGVLLYPFKEVNGQKVPDKLASKRGAITGKKFDENNNEIWRVQFGLGKDKQIVDIPDAELRENYYVHNTGTSIVGNVDSSDGRGGEESGGGQVLSSKDNISSGDIDNVFTNVIDELDNEDDIKAKYPNGLSEKEKDFILKYAMSKSVAQYGNKKDTSKLKKRVSSAKSRLEDQIEKVDGLSPDEAAKKMMTLLKERTALESKMVNLRNELIKKSKEEGKKVNEVDLESIGYENPEIVDDVDAIRNQMTGYDKISDKGESVKYKGSYIDKFKVDYRDNDGGLRLLDDLYNAIRQYKEYGWFGKPNELRNEFGISEKEASFLLDKFNEKASKNETLKNMMGKLGKQSQKHSVASAGGSGEGDDAGAVTPE